MEVSLIIPVFNSFDYIDECIASVIQFPEIKEIICIDDKSSDGSLEKLQHWASLEKRIIVLENKGLQGCGPSRNMGIEESTCEFIAFLDSDDYFFPNRFYSDKDIFIEFPWIEGVSNAIVRSDNLIIGPKTHGRLLTFKNYINGDTVSFTGLTLRKSVFSKIGVFNEDFLLGQDVIFHSKLLEECKIISGNVSEPVAFYRIHNNNSTKNDSNVIKYGRKQARHLLWHQGLKKIDISLIIYFFKKHLELDYKQFFQNSSLNKKIIKLFLLPYTLLRLIFPKN